MEDYSQLHSQLTSLRQWVVRRGKEPFGIDPETNRISPKAWDDPKRWMTFEQALERSKNYDGIGFIVARNSDGLSVVGGDLDCCRNPRTGTLSAWAISIIEEIKPFYTEPSISGTGIRFFALGHLPNNENKIDGHGSDDLLNEDREAILAAKPKAVFNGFELYEDARHLTITGKKIAEYCFEPEDRTEAIEEAAIPFLAAKATKDMKAGNGKLPQIDILDVIDTSSFFRSGGQLLGPHPTEGSTTGKNLVVDPAKNVYCWMHDGINAGGDAWIWLACECGAVRWEDAGPGALKDRAVMNKTVKYAIEKVLVTSDQVKTPEGGLEARINKRVQEWIAEHHFKTVSDTERLYRYDHGVYLDDGETVLKALIESEFGDKTTNRWVGDIVGKVKRRTYVDRELFNSEPVLNVKNGLLDLETLQLRPHTPDYLSTAQLDVAYDSTARSPEIIKFISEVVQPIDVPLIEEIFGWLLWPDYHIHKAVMLLGPGRNGKGTLLRLITAFLGRKSISNVTLQDLVADRFSKADLYGKIANIGGDLPSKDLSDTAAFRNLTGGDDNRAQEKYRAAFNFRNKAKLLFSANVLPRSPDDTYAFYSRWILIEFLNVFDLQKGTADPNLDEKLQAQDELSGLLNMALAGLARLRRNGWKFSYSKSVEDVETMYKRNSNPVLAFLMDECDAAENSYIEKTVFLNKFNEYARKHGIKPLSTTKFGVLLKDQTEIPVSDYRPHFESGKAAPRCWLGVRIRPVGGQPSGGDGGSKKTDSNSKQSPESDKVVYKENEKNDSVKDKSTPSIVSPTPSSPENRTMVEVEEKKGYREDRVMKNYGRYGLLVDQLDEEPAPILSEGAQDSDSIQTALAEAKGRAEENEAHANEQAKKYMKVKVRIIKKDGYRTQIPSPDNSLKFVDHLYDMGDCLEVDANKARDLVERGIVEKV